MSTLETMYTYTPLDPKERLIRLIELRPGQDDQPVSCRVLITSLSNPTTYEALSYRWDDSEDKTNISSNNCVFRVGSILAGILQGLRDQSTCRSLWVDAICINQNDDLEKGQQVSQMLHIYNQAQRTIVWLGGHQKSSRQQGALAFKELARVGQLINAHRLIECYRYAVRDETPPWLVNRPTTTFVTFGVLLEIGRGLLNPSAWPMTKFLSKQPWWRRAWILQEVVVAKEVKVVFGSVACDWSDFIAPFLLLQTASDDLINLPAISKIFGNPGDSGVPAATARAMLPMLDYQGVDTNALRQRRVLGDQFKLLDLLCVQRKAQSSKSVDKIYSLVGMLSTEQRAALRPDYILQNWKVFQHVAKFLVESTGRLDFLCMVRRLRPDRRRQDLSSWTPDWGTELQDPLGYQPFQNLIFNASADTTGVARFSEDLMLMTVQGIYFDEVEKVSFAANILLPQHVHTDIGPHWSRMFSDLAARENCVYRSREEKVGAWWRTIIADQTQTPNGVTRAGPETENQYAYFMREGDPGPESWRLTTSIEERRKISSQPYVNAVAKAIGYSNNRRLFVTKRGYLGLGPGNTNEGDTVCILLGAAVPFILRKQENDEFACIGEVYVDGVMDGEIMQEPRDEKFVHRDFTMR
jgi:hypothetical protein